MKFILIFFAIGFAVSSFAQEKNTLTEKEWKIRLDKAKERSEKSVSELSQDETSRVDFYRTIHASLGQFDAQVKIYDLERVRFKKDIFKLTLLQQGDTSGYDFRYVVSTELKRVISLKDSLYDLMHLIDKQRILNRQIGEIINSIYYTDHFEFQIEQYEKQDSLVNQIKSYSKTLVKDTSITLKLLRTGTKELGLMNESNERVVRNINDCLDKLKNQYLENSESSFPQAYERYFRADKEDMMNPPKESKLPVKEEIFGYVDEPADFSGGITAFKEYVWQNFRQSGVVLKDTLETKVSLNFVVSRHGRISNVNMKRGFRDCLECDTEILRIVRESPDWFPARNKGKTVNSHYTFLIEFKPQK